MFDRRQLIAGGIALAGGAGAAPRRRARFDLIGDVQRRSFRFFWEQANPANGLMPDRWPNLTFASIAATGFALTAYPVGVERGWITRAQAAARTLATLRFFATAPHGPAATGVTGHKGFFYHFLHLDTGLRYRDTELSSVDTTLLVAGMLFAARYFDRPGEAEIRDLAQAIYARCDWRWFQLADKRVSMGWHPESGFIDRAWYGYTEAQILYVLALGAPDHALDRDAYDGWASTYVNSWRSGRTGRFLAFGPHFAHQYSQCWLDLRGLRDTPMRAAGLDYFENSRRATIAQRDYAIANPGRWTGYSADVWGLTACDGPLVMKIGGRQFNAYAARGPIGQPDGLDDGTIAPTAALASLPFAPDLVEPAARALHARYGAAIYRRYGFVDAFNPSFTTHDAPIERGKVTATAGWVDDDYLGIDQGPIVAMIENHRSGLIWRHMRGDPAVRRGLRRAGFSGGWLG